MKKYNLVLLFILILITISISSYFLYLDIMYKDKIVRKDVKELYDLKRSAGRPIAEYANANELESKVYEYNEIIIELNIDAMAEINKHYITIKGKIHNGFSYILLKRLLNVIKNDQVNMMNSCIGQDCIDSEYGFLINIRPYTLKLK